MNDLDLSSLATGPAPVLAPASAVRARGEQRTRRRRASLAGSAALVVLASAGTAVALTHGGEPQSLQIADNGTKTPDGVTPTSGPGALPWSVFPSVDRVAGLIPGDWVSSAVIYPDPGGDYDRCDPTQSPTATQPREVAVRHYVTTDGKAYLALSVKDYSSRTKSSDATAATALHDAAAAIRRCPTITTDGPGRGSQNTATILSSTPDGYQARDVQHECQGDNTGCTDSPSLTSVLRSSNLVVIVSMSPEAASVPPSALASLAAELAGTASHAYGSASTPIAPHVDAQVPAVGGTFYAAVLAPGGTESLQAARDDALAAGYATVSTMSVRCLGGATNQLLELQQHANESAVLLLFPDSAAAELFVDGWPHELLGVARITLRCTR